MPTADVVRKFRSAVKRGNLADVEVVYRVSGGMPEEGPPLNEELRLSGANEASARSAGLPGESREGSAQIEEARLRGLYQQVGQSLEGMVPRRKARFLPDTVIGSITLKVAGEETTLFFDADAEAEQRRAGERSLVPGEADALTSLDLLKQELLSGKEE